MGSDSPLTSERQVRHPAERGEQGTGVGNSAPATAGIQESREQIIERRRAAQLDWRRARQHVERAVRALPTAAAADRRRCLEQAQSEERSARSLYYRVARETGALLSRLHRGAASPTA